VSEPALATAAAPPARLQDLFAALDAAEMRWSLLRPPAALGRARGDIDVLVGPQDLAAAQGVLHEHGFVGMPIGRPDELHAADYDAASDRFQWLHVQPALRLGRAEVPARAVLATLQRDPLPPPADDWLLWIVLLHGLLDKRAIAERHRPEIRRLAALGDPAAPAPLATIATRGGLDPACVLELARAGDWERLERLPIRGSTRPSIAARLRGVTLGARRVWDARGVAVAVLGPDGTGKTTLVNGLRASLPFPTRILYMGLTGGRLRRADALGVPGVVLAARLAILWVRWGSAATTNGSARAGASRRPTTTTWACACSTPAARCVTCPKRSSCIERGARCASESACAGTTAAARALSTPST